MGSLRPRREIIVSAFELALRGKYAKLICLEPLTGMNVDAASMIIRKTEMLRLKPNYKGSKRLRPAVQEALIASGLPHGLRYAYEVVVLCYYNHLSRYQAALRRKRRETTKRRIAELKAQQPVAA